MPNESEEAIIEKDGGENEEFASQITEEEIKKPLLEEIARKKHWREKFQKASDNVKKLEEELKKAKETPAAPTEKKDSSPAISADDIEARVDLRMSGYSRDEIRYMETFAKGQGKRLTEVANDPFVLSGIAGLREKGKAEQATPAPSSRTGTGTKPNKNWAEMTPKEREANFGTMIQKFSKGGKTSNE